MNTEMHQSVGGVEFQPGQVQGGVLVQNIKQDSVINGIKPTLSLPSLDSKEQEIKLKFAEETHQYVRDYIRQADQKATFLFAGASTLVAYLNSTGIAQRWLSNPGNWTMLDVLAFFATIGLMIGAACCAFVITPRLSGSKKGLVFFNAIQEHETPGEYASEINSKTSAELCEAKLKHIHELSKVCREKFSFLSWAFKFSLVGAFLAFLLIVVK